MLHGAGDYMLKTSSVISKSRVCYAFVQGLHAQQQQEQQKQHLEPRGMCYTSFWMRWKLTRTLVGRKSKQTRRKAARQGTAAPSALGTPSATPTDWDSGPSNSRTINFLDRLQTPNHDEKGLHSETALSNSLHDDDTISRRTTPFPEPHKYAEMSAIGLTSKVNNHHTW